MITNLTELIAPLTPGEFSDILETRSPRLVRGAGADGRFASLLDWQGLMAAVLDGAYPAKDLRITQRGTLLPGKFFRDGDMPKADVIEALMAQGASIVAYGIGPSIPAIATVARAIALELGEHVLGSAIATTGNGGALDVHYDDGDLIVLQVDGRKRWRLFRDPADNPIPGMAAADDTSDAVLLDAVLDPGDLLFVPAGYRHCCENEAARSLHLGFFLYPLTAVRALDLAARRLAAGTEGRQPFRGLLRREDEIKRRLIAAIEATPLEFLLDQHREADPYPAKSY